MIIKLLGLFDIVAATLIVFGLIIPKETLFFTALYLAIKGTLFAFTGDPVSFVDIAIGIYAAIMVIGFSWIVITILCAIFLYQKGFFSLI